MPDGRLPEPGGWNRFAIEVTDLDATAATLPEAGVHFRNDVMTGAGSLDRARPSLRSSWAIASPAESQRTLSLTTLGLRRLAVSPCLA